jgi:hypothetical protein
MTTNSARQQAQQTPSPQEEREQPLGTDILIPVLIRLPDVSGSVASAPAASEAHIVWQNSPVPPEAAPAAGSTTAEPPTESQPTATPQASSQTANGMATESAHTNEHSFWSDFSLPAPVVNAAVALSLIAVFVVAYMVIVGGGGDAKEVAKRKPTTGDEATSRQVQPDDEVLDGGVDLMMPEIPEMPPAPSASAQAAALSEEATPEASATPTTEPPANENATTPSSDLDDEQLARQGATDVEQTQSPSNPEATGSEQTRLAAQSEAASIQQTKFKSPAPPALAETNQPGGDSRSAEIENRWATGFSNEVPRASDDSVETARGGFYNNPLTSNVPAADTNPVANPPQYPSTNPVSFQYPANYHEHLIGATSREASRPTVWSNEASVHGQQPSTAYMRPRMDAPPVR